MEEEFISLKSRISELESRHSIIEQDRTRLFHKSQSFSATTCVNVVVEDPQVEMLRRELKGLICENKTLVEGVRRFKICTV